MSIAFFESTLVRKSVAEVTRRKRRSLLVILSILIGVFGLTAINVFEFKLINAYAFQQDRTHYPDITFSVNNINPAQVSQLATVANVQAAQMQMAGTFQWLSSDTPTKMSIIAFQDPQRAVLEKYDIVKGRAPGMGEIAMEIEDATFQRFALGDVIHVSGPHGTSALRVVAIVKTAGIGQLKGGGVAQGYMSQEGLSQLLGSKQYNSIAIKARDFNQIHETAQAISAKLQAMHVTIRDMQVQSSVGTQVGNDFLTGLFNLVRLLAAGAIAVSCFLIANTLLTLIAEQTRIIGTMKAVGGTRGKIIMSYLFTVGIYSIIGTLFGIAGGIVGGYAVAERFAQTKFLDLGRFSIEPGTIVLSLLAGLAIPLLAALPPLFDGTRITVREALAAYGVTRSSARAGRVAQWVASRLTWIPQTFWLGFRGLFRKRGRAIMTIAALALSGMTFLAVMTVRYSIGQLAAHLYDSYSYDVVVMNSDAQPYLPLSQQMDRVPNIAKFEPGYIAPVSTQWGVIDLVGLEQETTLYRKPIVAGHWFTPQDSQTILLDNNFMQRAHLSIGDTLQLADDNGHSARWHIIGAVNDYSPIVGSYGVAITSINDVNAFTANRQLSANELFVQAKDRSPQALQQLEAGVNQALEKSGGHPGAKTRPQQVNEEESSAVGIYIIFYVAAAGVAVVGILGLYNTLTSSVLERQREIGVWRAMGARGAQITRVFWIEGLSLTVLAWLISCVIGLPLSYGFVQLFSSWLFPIPYAFDPVSPLWMLLAMVIIAMLASLGPTIRAGRVRIAEILRYE
jgi:putative ABC transport system permease protein